MSGKPAPAFGPSTGKGAWVTCEHNETICAGPNQGSMQPTGKDPECFRDFLAELMEGNFGE